jgi:hypothetical protein
MANMEKPGAIYWSLVEPIWDSISIYDGPAVFLHQFRTARPEVGHLLAAHWCQSEVCNGGFHQFFCNSTGVLAPEALNGFLAIGLHEWARLLEEAMRFFGRSYPREREVRVQELPSASGEREKWDPFFSLDEQFYEWLHAEDYRFERAADEYAKSII